MVYILIVAIAIAVISIAIPKTIRKYNTHLYTAAIVLVLFTTEHSGNLVNLGYVPIAFFVVVMFSGLLEKGFVRNRLFMVRAELAILGSILMFPHVYGYLEFYLNRYSITAMSGSFYLGLVAYLLMIPLFLTSIKSIRRKMSFTTWKRLHRLAYVFFLLVGLHLIALQNENMWLYVSLFGFYVVMKTAVLIQEKAKKTQKLKQQPA